MNIIMENTKLKIWIILTIVIIIFGGWFILNKAPTINQSTENLISQIEQNEAISKALEYWSKEEGYSGMGVPEVRLRAGNVTEYRNYWLVEICSLNMNTKEMKTLGFVIVSKVENIVKKETERYKECISKSNFTPTLPSIPKHMDKNNNRISDEVEDKIKAENRRIEVIITLREPCTREDLDNFESLGGNIRHIYNSVFYGFSGDIPSERIFMLAKSLNALYFIEMNHEIDLH